MKVFQVQPPEGFEWLLPIHDSDIELIKFEGRSKVASWKPVRMYRLKASSAGDPLVFSDFPSYFGGDVLIISETAKEKVGFCLEQYGELLPLSCDEGIFWALNVTCLVDALDEERSELWRASDTGQIMTVRKPVLRAEAIGNNHIFKLTQTPRGLIYVTDSFVELVTPLNLRGIGFEQVWSSD